MNTAISQETTEAIKERIEAIPGAMRQMGWRVSAALMERWLKAPAWELPHHWKGDGALDPARMSRTHLDHTIVSMHWAMSHVRVREALRALRPNIANQAARRLLASRLSDLQLAQGNAQVGSLKHTAVELEKLCHSNSLAFGTSVNTLDDLYGALGKATLKVALIGEAAQDRGASKITYRATHAGFYIRDTYDFNDFQYLGTWTKSGVLNKAQMLMNVALDGLAFRWGGEPIGNIYNHDFETYRRATGRGGDFIIYSDVHWEPVDLLLELP